MQFQPLKQKLDYSPWYKEWLETQGGFDLGKTVEPKIRASLTKEDIERYAGEKKNDHSKLSNAPSF
jgi:hypothetical protein